MKSEKRKQKKLHKKILLKRLNLEKEVQNKPEIIEDKKEIPNDDFINEMDAAGIISSREFSQILKSEAKLNKLENIPVRASLEGGLIFAPRMKERKDAEGKIYSDMKYDKKYNEPRYSEKTPGAYAEKTESPGKESSNDSGSNGNK